jgi:hypothetical protein
MFTNLAQFKNYLSNNIGKNCKIVNYLFADRTRETKVIHVQSNSFAVQTQNKAKKDSKNIYDHAWAEFGKSTSWSFEETKETLTASKLNPDNTKAFEFIFLKD